MANGLRRTAVYTHGGVGYRSTDELRRHSTKMCVALVLVLNNFYLLYDSLVDYCEHITGALLLFATVAIIFVPVIATLTADEDNDERHFVAIIVLFAGVVGGLAVVIIFVFFCKSCFRKRPPLTTTRDPDHKREHQRNIGATNHKPLPLPPGFHLTPDGPVPTKLNRYMPQPSQHPDNNKFVARKWLPQTLFASPYTVGWSQTPICTLTEYAESKSTAFLK
uniref:Uncharacterized protein n=1 Tax=Plectus sambesii TaxID=2011161 RepID=A0A914WSJ7_9BILA